MPLVTLTVRRGKDASFKSAVLNAVHNALVASGLVRSGSWQTLQGDARWTWQASDSFNLSADAERAPVLTDSALAQGSPIPAP